MERHGNVAGRYQAELHEAILVHRKTRYRGHVQRGPRVWQEARRLSQLLPLSSRSPQASGSGTQPVQKKARLETNYDLGTGSIPPKYDTCLKTEEKRRVIPDLRVLHMPVDSWIKILSVRKG